MQLAVKHSNAAKMLDMQPREFSRLVSMGCLPPPVKLADGVERWRVEDLQAILSGKMARPDEGMEV